MGLWYSKSKTFDLIVLIDANFIGCRIDRKSTFGTCKFLSRALISSLSRTQEAKPFRFIYSQS